MILRPATPSDNDDVNALVAAAFGGGEVELDIIGQIRSLGVALPGLELVAADGASLIGHILLSAGDLDGRAIPAVAPLSVHPDRQRTGVGSALMAAALSSADEQGWPLVALLGHPGYYPRFGFEPGRAVGVVYPPVDGPAFMVRRLGGYDPSCRGTFRFGWEGERMTGSAP